MGVLQELLYIKALQRMTSPDKAPKADDTAEVTDQIWNFLFNSALSTISKADVIKATEMAYPKIKAAALLNVLGAKESYSKKSKVDFVKLLTGILSNVDKYEEAKQVKPLGRINPGGKITGGTTGSIGGFLTNDSGEIFLFGDAHVMTTTMIAPRSKTTPQQQLTDKVKKNDVVIGVVVCNSQIQRGGDQNYDMALAKIDPNCYDKISLDYQPSKGFTNGKSFHQVTAVDTSLSKGKRVFLYGNATGYREGTLVTGKPEDVSDAPYGHFIGSQTNENVTIHGCIQVETVKESMPFPIALDQTSAFTSCNLE